MEILSDHHRFLEGYIHLSDIQLSGLPTTTNVKGHKLLRKDEFHISLVDVNGVANLIDPQSVDNIEAEIIEEFKKFLEQYKLDKFRLLNQFRYVVKDIRKTVIVMCDVPDAEEFFALLGRKYKKSLPRQPNHITLYTLQENRGIGILSDEELAECSEPIDLPELKRVKRA